MCFCCQHVTKSPTSRYRPLSPFHLLSTQDASGKATERAFALGAAVGSGYMYETTFQKEVRSLCRADRLSSVTFFHLKETARSIH